MSPINFSFIIFVLKWNLKSCRLRGTMLDDYSLITVHLWYLFINMYALGVCKRFGLDFVYLIALCTFYNLIVGLL